MLNVLNTHTVYFPVDGIFTKKIHSSYAQLCPLKLLNQTHTVCVGTREVLVNKIQNV